MKKIITDKLVEKIAQSLTETQLMEMQGLGYAFVDELKTEDFLLYLLKFKMKDLSVFGLDESLRYQLAMQKHGKSATNLEQQMERKKEKTDPKEINKNPISLMSQGEKIIKKIEEWCIKYKVLNISSVNVDNITKWLHNILILSRYYGINFKIKHTNALGYPVFQISL